MSGQTPPMVRRHLLSLAAIACLPLAAPWPGLQAIVHIFLILGLAPGFPSPLTGLLWSAAAGWVVEGSLRLTPHMGATPLANMLICLTAYALLVQWPPHTRRPFWGRMAALAALHWLLANLLLRLAGGPHAWGFQWVFTLGSVPLWATLALKLHEPIHRR
ncbi:hypothetical protein [Mesoterricola sediminis]|uniref:Uncharacterized protein n=1 Tax=Mesoterricola sediminis TaxID=2927980 RepID=A0AA48KHE9_9BACT|nr:hypothetical protein [Mesoterricola sediminis]BDU78308.1 hypothetical protein METESE_32660 [Mesoterricola sediminis]